jgi:hypothetical protein
MRNGKTALLAAAGALLTSGAAAMLTAASDRAPGPSSVQIATFELMAQARNLPDQAIENLF